MKCVCRKRCQARLDSGKIATFAKGEVADFLICPPHFEPLEGEKAAAIDFNTAGEDELLEAEYDPADLKKYIEETFDKKPGNRGKEKLVDFLIDCRFRQVTDAELGGLV